MVQDNKEKYINPYTDFGFKKLFDQAEIARYSETERRQYEESKKVFLDNYSVLKTAEKKAYWRLPVIWKPTECPQNWLQNILVSPKKKSSHYRCIIMT